MDFAAARSNMIENQIRANRVIDARIVNAMASLPRERFVPKLKRGVAYMGDDLDIGNGRYLMNPMVLGQLLESAEIKQSDLVLEIGAGAGYATAILSRLAGTVVSLESDADLVRETSALLGELGVDNAAVIEGKLADGYAKQAPYDVIFINGAVAEVPAQLLAQIGEGGRLVAVIAGKVGLTGRIVVYTRSGNAIGHREAFEAATHILSGFERRQSFVF
jgi:protein-L-isoaspartate(D-aspartate) O-methyltransferase